MAEMTAATEEYFAEIQRLRRLLLIEQQCTARNTSSSADYYPTDVGGRGRGAEGGVRSPSRYCASLRDRVSGVSSTTRSYAQQRLGVESVEADETQREQRRNKSHRLPPDRDDHPESANRFFTGQGARHAQTPDIEPTILREEMLRRENWHIEPIILHEKRLRREYQQGSWAPDVRERVTQSEFLDGGPYNQRLVSAKGRHRRPPSTTRRILSAPPVQIPTRAAIAAKASACLLYTSPSPRDLSTSRMPSSA